MKIEIRCWCNNWCAALEARTVNPRPPVVSFSPDYVGNKPYAGTYSCPFCYRKLAHALRLKHDT